MQDGVLVRYLMTIVEVMQTDYHVDDTALWAEAGLTPLSGNSATDRVSTDYADKFWLAASKLADEFLGLRVGAAVRYTSYASLGHLLVTCETVGDTLRIITENAHYVGAGYFDLIEREDEYHLEYKLDVKHPVLQQRAVASLLPFSVLGKSTAGGALPSRVWLQLEEPANSSLFTELFGVPVSYGEPTNGVAWDKQVLQQRMPDANSALNELLLQHVKMELNQQLTVAAKVTTIIQELIEVTDTDGPVTLNLDYCAEIIGTSRRSLQRALEAEGVNFRNLLSDVRRQRAEYMLKNTTFTISEIAEKLGYSESAAFVRAFHAWKQTSPSKYRANCQIYTAG
ncbi:MAG: AraC family transcriptional regulator ligand-binding domain-containing protein [Kordiimonas sp.]